MFHVVDREGCTDIPLITGTNEYIPNSALSASTTYYSGSSPARSRLNSLANGMAGAWVPLVNDLNQWIQV